MRIQTERGIKHIEILIRRKSSSAVNECELSEDRLTSPKAALQRDPTNIRQTQYLFIKKTVCCYMFRLVLSLPAVYAIYRARGWLNSSRNIVAVNSVVLCSMDMYWSLCMHHTTG
jgi:hypothetical protein